MAAIALMLGDRAAAQVADAAPDTIAGIPVNYTESLAGRYTLPDPLVIADGTPVRDEATWFDQRRPEILRLFEQHQFGRAPGKPAEMTFDVFDAGTRALDNSAIRRQIGRILKTFEQPQLRHTDLRPSTARSARGNRSGTKRSHDQAPRWVAAAANDAVYR
ncbi:MAG: hypothetical protein ACREM1_10830 [Longimicrobiales bacterium]